VIVGLGVDIVEIERIRRVISSAGGRFIERVYTPAETEFCARQRDPAPHFAARFAAKESLFKALGPGWAEGVQWRDVEVERGEGGRPMLVLRGNALAKSVEIGAARFHVSLTHGEGSAVAVVILES
jgi:holo-[acyl-carrier protein] synthase